MKLGDRWTVGQGVDQVGTCIQASETNGSWSYTFEYDASLNNHRKGSITVNGVSLTVVNSKKSI
jgi:riboflavin synthase